MGTSTCTESESYRGLSITELAMCQLSARIRASPEWLTKIHDQKAREQWRLLAAQSFRVRTSSETVETRLSSHQIGYVLDELGSYATLYDAVTHCQVSCFDRIWESTVAVDLDLLARVCSSIKILRPKPLSRRTSPCDGRAKQIISLDIIDPYMHPVVYERTYAYDHQGELRVTTRPQVSPEAYAMSEAFAWIPTLFYVKPSLTSLSTRAISYITGVDPSHRSVYSNIQDLLATTIPLFERVLTDLSRDNPLPHRIPGDYRYTEWEEPEEPEHSDDEEGWLDYQQAMAYWTLNRPIQCPDVTPEGYRGGLESRYSETTLRGENIMAYTKVTEIRLRPGGPCYNGTPWHAEGMRNEHIAAVAMICVSMNNITAPNLEFRMPVRSPRRFLPGDVGATFRAWGLNAGAASHQYIGTTTIRLHHIIAFPNIYQHRLTEAHLQDNNKEGTMTIVTFFLVDPEMSRAREVLSTAAVPPQCAEWVRKAVEESLDVRIPMELVDKIMGYVEGLMSEEEAAQFAARMKRERELFWTIHDQQWFSLPFNIWEN